MTPDAALSVLDQMAARAPGNRADHIAAQEALQVLAAVIEPPSPDPAAPLGDDVVDVPWPMTTTGSTPAQEAI